MTNDEKKTGICSRCKRNYDLGEPCLYCDLSFDDQTIVQPVEYNKPTSIQWTESDEERMRDRASQARLYIPIKRAGKTIKLRRQAEQKLKDRNETLERHRDMLIGHLRELMGHAVNSYRYRYRIRDKRAFKDAIKRAERTLDHIISNG